MKNFRRILSCALVAALLFIGEAYGEGKVKYMFLFIGDGTSIPQRNATELFLASLSSPVDITPSVKRAEGKLGKDQGIADFTPATKRLLMNSFPGQGLSTTYSTNSVITDSSSSATAIASGKKTQDGVVGMDPYGKENYISIASIAKEEGKKVGIISAVSLEHATPAAFYAHSPSRDSYYDIGIQLTKSNFDFFGGGGFKQPKGKKGDQKSIFDYAEEAGYKVVNNRKDFEVAAGNKIIAINPVLDSDSALPYDMDRKDGEIALHEFVKKGIELLDGPEGFFMMVEGGKIDWACHANDAVAAIKDVIALDEAVKVAHEFYLKHPDETLIIVTGDHETGGMAVGFAGTRYDTFLTKMHDQKGSYIEFNKFIEKFRNESPNGKFEDFMPVVTDFYGLKLLPPDDKKALEEKAKAGDKEAVESLALVLKPHEESSLREAFVMSMTEPGARPSDDEMYYLSYGKYEPLTVTLTHVLNNKAGVAWTTYSHTGLPTPVSSIGVGYENFSGYFDNTDIFKKMLPLLKP